MSLQLHFAPKTRAFTALWLVEELGQPYELLSFRLSSGRHKEPDFLEMNPLGKVPTVVHDGVPVSETGAIAVYLGDAFPDVGLAPEPRSKDRAAYLRWIFFNGSVMEPAYGERFFKWENIPSASVAWGSFDQMLDIVTKGVTGREYLVGDTFTFADLIVGNTIRFGQNFGILPKDGPLGDYTSRLMERDAFKRAMEIEAREDERLPDA